MEILKVSGIYRNGKINVFGTNSSIKWDELSSTGHPELPDGYEFELTISLNDDDLLSGKFGFVWATYDLRQAEIIYNTLLSQNINTEINNINTRKAKLYLLKVTDQTDENDAIDFIWKSESGLQLKPDWNYSEDKINISFEQWLSGK